MLWLQAGPALPFSAQAPAPTVSGGPDCSVDSTLWGMRPTWPRRPVSPQEPSHAGLDSEAGGRAGAPPGLPGTHGPSLGRAPCSSLERGQSSRVTSLESHEKVSWKMSTLHGLCLFIHFSRFLFFFPYFKIITLCKLEVGSLCLFSTFILKDCTVISPSNICNTCNTWESFPPSFFSV